MVIFNILLTPLITTVLLTFALNALSKNDPVYYSGERLVINSAINAGLVRQVQAAIELAKPPITDIQISSHGGDIDAAMDLGLIIFKHKLNVYVPHICISSCANYIFSAAQNKRLGQHAILAFHGGANQTSLKKSHLNQTYLETLITKEALFFNTIKVQRLITSIGQTQPYNIQGFWDYDLSSLLTLGVHSILIVDDSEKIIDSKNRGLQTAPFLITRITDLK